MMRVTIFFFERLYEIIEQRQKEENNRVILFSSFRHTLRYVLILPTMKSLKDGMQ